MSKEVDRLSLYERMGGDVKVRDLTNLFFDNLLADRSTEPPIATHFAHVSDARIAVVRYGIGTLVGRMFGGNGGPEAIDMDKFAAAHRRLDITDEQFNVTIGHLTHACEVMLPGQELRALAQERVQPYVEPFREALVKSSPEAAL